MAILDFTPAKLDLVLYKRDDAQFHWTWTQGLYDLQVTLSNGDVKTLATGTITIKGDISYE